MYAFGTYNPGQTQGDIFVIFLYSIYLPPPPRKMLGVKLVKDVSHKYRVKEIQHCSGGRGMDWEKILVRLFSFGCFSARETGCSKPPELNRSSFFSSGRN